MNNLRGIFLMCLAMAGFALEDMIIKLAAAEIPTGQVVVTLGLIGAGVVGAIARRQGHRLWSMEGLRGASMIRIPAELLGAICFVSAITLTPLSSASAILQATPLLVALGGAIFLKERVGWRRWSAILVGLCGVLIIVRPGASAFEPLSILAVLAAIALATRDLAIKAAPPSLPSAIMAFQGTLVFGAGGLVLLAIGPPVVSPTPLVWGYLIIAGFLGVLAYFSIITAIRIADVALVSPFRYTRLLFALVIGITVFGERPDALTYVGAAIVIFSGLYTLYREQRMQERAPV